jgi:hypothetical protein
MQKVPLSFYSRKLMAPYVEGMRKPSEPELHSGPLQIGHETWKVPPSGCSNLKGATTTLRARARHYKNLSKWTHI